MSKDLCVGVWTGGDDRSIHFRNITMGSGAYMSLPVFGKFMDAVYSNQELMEERGYSKGKFPRPETLNVQLDCSQYLQFSRDSTEYMIPTGDPLRNDF
jgi:penicillin-binding protein 1A